MSSIRISIYYYKVIFMPSLHVVKFLMQSGYFVIKLLLVNFQLLHHLLDVHIVHVLELLVLLDFLPHGLLQIRLGLGLGLLLVEAVDLLFVDVVFLSDFSVLQDRHELVRGVILLHFFDDYLVLV